MASAQEIYDIVAFIKKTWPDLSIAGGGESEAERIARWVKEVESGARSVDSLRADIFKHIVTPERVEAWVIAEFDFQGEPYTAERITRIASELSSGSRHFNVFRADLYKARGYVDQGGGIYTKETPEADKPPPKVGGVGDATTSILTSKDMKWHFDEKDGMWYVSYKLPNSDRYAVFAATGEQMDAIFGDGQRPTAFEPVSFKDLTAREGYTFAGDITEVHGTGTFEGEVDRVVALGLDEGILPEWASNDPKVMDILYLAQMEDKSDEWVIEQLSKLPSFKARFPGLDALTAQGLTLTEAVTGFLEFESGIKSIILRDGGDPASVTPDMVGDLLAQGHSLTDVAKTYDIFDRLEKSAGALAAFNEVLVANGQEPLTEDEQFEFMSGNSPRELYDIWEQASLHQAAIEAGLDIGVEAAIDLARRTEGLTSFGTATEGLQTAAANMLRFRGELELDQFGLNQADLIDMSLGLAPSSGASQADVGMAMERAFSAAQAKRDRARVNPFKQFTGAGVTQSASLQGVRQESS